MREINFRAWHKKDKNGKEIYEGDIIRSHPEDGSCGIITSVNGCSTEDRIVIWLEKDVCFSWQLLDGQINSSGFSLCKSNSEKIFEIIGNVHENPEMFGDKE